MIGDALFNNTRTEPWWFLFLRRLFALFFIITVCTYGYYQLQYFTSFVETPNIVIIETKKHIDFPGFVICPGAVSPAFAQNTTTEMPIVEPQFVMTCGNPSITTGPEILSENVKDTDNACNQFITKEENGCLRFENKNTTKFNNENDYINAKGGELNPYESGLNKTFMFFNIKPKVPDIQEDTLNPPEVPLFYTVYFDHYQNRDCAYSQNCTFFFQNTNDTNVDDEKNNYVEYNMFPIITGQRTILEYSIFIHRVFKTNIMGLLDARPDMYSMEIKADTKTIPRRQTTINGQPLIPETQFIVLPKNPHYMREEIEKYEYKPSSVISNLGGFYGAIVGLYVACFGMSRVEPWGILQKVLFRCWPCRRSFKRCLAAKYVSAAGIPLGEDVKDRPEGASLEDRLQILEYLLRDLYIDPYYLDKLKSTKVRYDDRETRYTKLEDLAEARNKAVENNKRIVEQDYDEYLKERERKVSAKRWSNWSKKFGFSIKSKKDDFDISSINSSVPSPRKISRWSNWSNWSFFDSGGNSNSDFDEEVGISSDSSGNSYPPSQHKQILKLLIEECRDSQDTLVEIKISK